MKSALSIWILFGVTQALGVWFVSAHAESASATTLLQTELHKQYPEVESWIIKSVYVTRAKRPLQLFAQPTTDMTIYRDANLFVVRSTSTATQHFVVKANQRVLTATAFTRKGSSLQLAKTTYALRDVFTSGCESIADEPHSESWRLRRDVHANEAICRNDVEPAPLVSNHESLALTCTQGAVTVTVAAQALGDGWLGKTIKVRRGSNHTVVMARVTGRGEVNACI